MENNPTSSDLPPAETTLSAARRTNVGRRLSLLLILGGLVLISFGGWLYFRQYQELAHPPAPIVTAALVEVVATNTPIPTEPTAVTESPTQAPAKPAPTDTPAPAASALPPTAHAVASSNQSVEAKPATAEDTLTLADNPLVMADELDGEPADVAASEPVSNIETGSSLTRIVAESIGMDAKVVPVGWEKIIQNTEEVTVWSVASNAAGWHNNSLLPGQGGNVVLSGHHNVDGEVFRYIVDLEPGAIVTLYNQDGEDFNYAVEDKFIVKDKGEPDAVRQANARWIGPFNDERLTLVTCWPYTNNTHRVIVIAKPVNETQATSQ